MKEEEEEEGGEEEKEKGGVCCPICAIYILTGTWTNFQWPSSLRKLSPSPCESPPEAINCVELHFSILITMFKFSSMALCIGCYFWEVRWVGVEVVTEAFCVILSQPRVCSHLYHCRSSSLPLYRQREHRTWASTWLQETAETTDIHMISSGLRMCQGPWLGVWWQYRPQPSTWPSAAAWTMDAIIVLFAAGSHCMVLTGLKLTV